MPRKRHDTSDDDSDNNVKKKSKKSKKSSASSDKKQKDTASSKPRKVSESSSDSSPLKGRKTDGKRVKGQKRLDSESDTSPLKKGVQSRVERPGDKSKSRHGRQDSRDGRSADRPVAAEDTSPDRRRRRVPERSPDDPRYQPDPRQGRNVRGGLRSASPEPQHRSLDRFPIDSFDAHDYRVRPVEFDRRERDDFMRDRYQDDRVRRMQYGMLDRGDFRDDYRDRPLRLDDRERFDPRDRGFRREPISPQRGFPMRRMDSFSPDRMGMRNDPAAFQFDRRRSGSFEQDGRFQRRLSLSPLRRNERQRLDSDDRFNNSADADRPRRPLSPVRGGRRQMDRRSPSPDNSRFRKSASLEMAKSPVRQNKLEKSFEENKSPEPKTKSGKSGKKKKSSKNDKNDNDTKSSNKSKDEKRERSESLERSFERSKQSLIIPEEDLASKPESKKKSDTGKENKKSGKKNAAKRQRSASGSPPRAKKSKDDTEEVVQGTDKKSKKKEKKEKTSKVKNRASRSRSKSVDSLTLTSKKKNTKEKKDVEKTLKEKETKSSRKSRSRSPSHQERSVNKSKSVEKSSKEKETKSSKRSRSRSPSPQERSLNRSKSSDVSFDRKHDMAQFESEPESGEITDSEEEGKNALKSQVTVNEMKKLLLKIFESEPESGEITDSEEEGKNTLKSQVTVNFESEPESVEITDGEEEGKNALKSQVTVNVTSKPLDEAEEKKQAEEDEEYWNEKRKNSKKREEDITKQPSSKSGRDDVKKDQGGKRGRNNEDKSADAPAETEPPAKKPKPAGIEVLTGRTGGAYIPPAKLRAMQASITDKSSVEYQRISWEALKKSINGLVNKVNVSNIENIVRELFQENIVRGRGLFGRSIIQAQSASPTFTHVYAALVSIVNTKFPQNGELVLRRLIIQFRRGYKRNDKTICLSSTRFVAHLVNQQVAHEVLALEVLTLLLEEPTDDSVEVAIGFLKECGQKLTDVSPRGINAIFERLRHILHESQIDKRVQYMIEVMFAVRKDQFKDYPALVEELDLVEEEDQFTHLLTLEDAANGEELLNVFRPDPSFQENEEKYKILKKEILGEGSSDEEGSDGSGDDDDDDSSEEEQEEEDEEKKQTVIDQTETNMVALRRTIYLTIQSSLDFEECAHKLMKMDLKPGQEIELCNMILDCCAQMRTYEKFFGLLAGRFCVIDKKYVEPFQNMFKEQYDTIHRLETNKLRNVAKFFSHLLFTDSISWAVLFSIKLNEEDTTSASRIFIKILFQELSEYMGLPKLNERLKDPTLSEYFVGLMPRDNPRDTRFAINFFTTIGLGGLTDDLREHLKDVSKKLMQQKQEEQQKAAEKEESSDSSDSDSSSGSESDSESDSSSDSDSSEDEKTKKRKKKEAEKQKNKEKDKRKDKGKEKNDAQREKQKEKIKDKQREDRGKDKERGREKERSRDRERNNQLKNRKDKKGKKKQLSEAEIQKEKEKNFKRLARLANYDEEIIDPKLIRPGSDRDGRSRKSQENGDRRERRRNVDDREFDRDQRFSDGDRGDFDDDRIMRSRERGRDSDMYLDRSLERSYDSGYEREERFDGGEKRRRGKRSKDNVELDRNDPSIRVERNFERMDIYEDKFVRDRARNIEYLRSQPEFEDYYEGRSEDRRSRGGEREGRRREVEVDDPSFDARLYRDKGGSESRRRNRSEERVPVSREGGRRRR